MQFVFNYIENVEDFKEKLNFKEFDFIQLLLAIERTYVINPMLQGYFNDAKTWSKQCLHNLLFHKRNITTLDDDTVTIRLHKPMNSIMNAPFKAIIHLPGETKNTVKLAIVKLTPLSISNDHSITYEMVILDSIIINQYSLDQFYSEINVMLPFGCIVILSYTKHIIAKTKCYLANYHDYPLHKKDYFTLTQFQIENDCLNAAINGYINNPNIRINGWQTITHDILQHYESIIQTLNSIRLKKCNITPMQYHPFMGGSKDYKYKGVAL